MYVRPFGRNSNSATRQAAGSPSQASHGGAVGAGFWRRDGRALYYLAPGRGVMAVDVTAIPTLHTGTPKLLFRAPSNRASARIASVSPDGDRFLFSVPPESPHRQLTIIDRQGREIRTIGEHGPYGQPSLSPDGAKVAVIRSDAETANQEIWAFDVATGKRRVVTSGRAPISAPVWSPDGRDIAFVSTRGNYTGVYRKAWNGSSREELLYQHTAGAPGVVLTDWSADGRFLSFYAGDTLYALPVNGNRTVTEIERTEFSTVGGRFSPDGRFIAYLSDESGTYEVHIRPFSATADGAALPAAQRWQVSHQGAQGMILLAAGREGSLLSRSRWFFDCRGYHHHTHGQDGTAKDLVQAAESRWRWAGQRDGQCGSTKKRQSRRSTVRVCRAGHLRPKTLTIRTRSPDPDVGGPLPNLTTPCQMEPGTLDRLCHSIDGMDKRTERVFPKPTHAILDGNRGTDVPQLPRI